MGHSESPCGRVRSGGTVQRNPNGMTLKARADRVAQVNFGGLLDRFDPAMLCFAFFFSLGAVSGPHERRQKCTRPLPLYWGHTNGSLG